ncbi:pyruvate dehydrogenase (acetyl-transferring) E1 component subunit alpha [Candidatus Woesearchaeota archaeon]|nr:pyruvate dehydrogenase (acetyl-transferring) E1 component subunit alpha [Candidatus Woesearchaeota archaeon]
MVKKIIREFSVSYQQVMDEHGNVDSALMPKLSKQQIKQMYKTMVLVRAFDNKAFSLQRQGRIGTYLQVKGQEAAQVGSALALEDKDWVFPMYRSSGALIARKQPIPAVLLYWGGDERGLKSPLEVNNFPIAIPVGTQSLHAVGAAWASKIKGEKTVSLVYLGDGATSKEDCLSSMNFAGVFQTPTIFLVENNQYAISVPRNAQTRAETIAQRSLAFGFEGIQVDGNDIFGVYKATKDAIEKARKGLGPTLIECFTYRLADHSTSDDAKRYRAEQEVAEWLKKDPLERLEKYMRAQGILDDAYKEKALAGAKEKVEKGVEEYENTPPPDPADMFRYMFKEMPPSLKEQYESFLESRKK